jgi:DNA mismatch endonuclease, patch repair protein
MEQPLRVRFIGFPASAAGTAVMRGNRRRDTRPELELRRVLHAHGLRFRVDRRLDVAGARVRPDLVFPRQRVAVFVDGCFWHSCPCHGRKPQTNDAYWTRKLATNLVRDGQNTKALKAAGWQVIRVWEHQPAPSAAEAIIQALSNRDTV